ncbi:hypothetical protein H6G89_29360 [Oscillatoria sp. FACHB-1407]|uniref:hypothetical protein n=1 Tax=Oscillatoria sp. FACHB-1407 TaxID=2692847 RepID=UPI001686D533|nr:hypothetical protein [Oscillatoria sp. FACHB-1407]MBD2465119.1 hypothetical protein [Oscillatoria sp. FACHB-1407]
MQLLMHKPLWLHPHALIHHRPSDTIFVVHRLQQQRGTNALVLLTAPQDADPSERYLLAQCDRAWWHHFTRPRPVIDQGTSIWIDQPQNQLAIAGSGDAQRLELNEVREAALNFAEAFGGEIIQVSSETLLRWDLI